MNDLFWRRRMSDPDMLSGGTDMFVYKAGIKTELNQCRI
jgi:hypothetical protein